MPPSDPTQGASAGGELPAPAPRPVRRHQWRSRDAREFLPAALEVLETPANPLGRVIALTLAALFVIVVLWALIGSVDVVAVAQGRIVPVGGIKLIQPLEAGTVRAIHVRDGQQVKAGDLLVELDPTESEVDRDQLLRDREEAGVDFARLTAMLDGLAGGEATYTPPDGVDPDLAALHRDRLSADLASYQAQLASDDADLARQEAEEEALKAERDKLTETIPIIAEREEALRQLADQGLTARPKWLEVKTQLIGSQHDLTVLTHRIDEAAAGIVAAQKNRAKFVADTRRQAYVDLLDARHRLNQAEIALRKADQRERQHQLVAPVDGKVQQLAVHTVGGVVTPAETLMVIVPDTSQLEVEAFVLNRDKGFVRAGQDAVIKLQAFPFTRYGTIAGKVLHLSGDSIKDDKQGLVYDARLSLAATSIRADGEDVPLEPGMEVSVEIKTGTRRLIEYLLSPLLRYENEAMRER